MDVSSERFELLYHRKYGITGRICLLNLMNLKFSDKLFKIFFDPKKLDELAIDQWK